MELIALRWEFSAKILFICIFITDFSFAALFALMPTCSYSGSLVIIYILRFPSFFVTSRGFICDEIVCFFTTFLSTLHQLIAVPFRSFIFFISWNIGNGCWPLVSGGLIELSEFDFLFERISKILTRFQEAFRDSPLELAEYLQRSSCHFQSCFYDV